MNAPAGYPSHAAVLAEVEAMLDAARREGATVDEAAARAYAAQSWEHACYVVQELVNRCGAAAVARRSRT